MIGNNWLALVITMVLSLSWLRLMDFLASKGLFSSAISRKIIHIGTGPLFVVCWLLFTDDKLARYLAAVIPLAITIQFFFVGIGVIKDQAAVDGMSRSGDPREILKGPLYYGVVFVVLTVVFWKDTYIGIIALMVLCGGDGLADIVGTRFGKGGRIPWNKQKTIAGSTGMFVGGLVCVGLVMLIYMVAGEISSSFWGRYPQLIALVFIGTLVETLPFKNIDNITVPLATVIAGYLLL